MEPEFFVQLFVEFDESLKVPTIQNLLEKMCTEQQISFTEVHVPYFSIWHYSCQLFYTF